MTPEKGKVVCEDCYWRGQNSEALSAPNPFDLVETLQGCPYCKSVDSLVRVCDEPGCKNVVSCGWPSDNGYRSTCGKHYPMEKK